VRGAVVVAAGATIQPGGVSSNYQYMTFSNTLAFQADSTNHMDIYKSGLLLTNDLIVVSNLVTYAGTLRLQTNGPTPLMVGDAFKLFAAGSSAGNFSPIVDASGITWSFNSASGVATVAALPQIISTNAYLTSLVLSPAGTLAPAFASNTLSYTANEAYGNSPTVTVVNADFTATNQLIYNNATNLLASGVASGALALNANPAMPNVVKVEVKAQDGVTVKTYTVNVTQLPSQNQPFLSNSVSGGLLTLNWPLDHLGYRLQAQTNQLDAGLNTNWFTWPNSTNVNVLSVPLDLANPGMFFRLVYP